MTSAIVDLRNAVRPFLENLTAGDTALVAVSGGADSLALSYALIKEAPKFGNYFNWGNSGSPATNWFR